MNPFAVRSWEAAVADWGSRQWPGTSPPRPIGDVGMTEAQIDAYLDRAKRLARSAVST